MAEEKEDLLNGTGQEAQEASDKDETQDEKKDDATSEDMAASSAEAEIEGAEAQKQDQAEPTEEVKSATIASAEEAVIISENSPEDTQIPTAAQTEEKVEEETNQEEVVKTESGSVEDKIEEETRTTEADTLSPKEYDELHDAESKEEEEEDDEIEEKDFSKMSKAELVKEAEQLAKIDQVKKFEPYLKEIRVAFDEILEADRQHALEKFVSEGGDPNDFEFRYDDLINRFEASYKLLKDKRGDFYRGMEEQKDNNLRKKEALLAELRELVDGEETTASMTALKKVQEQWKSIGSVPAAQAKTLWANYHILIDRFYDSRSIYFELKELDRRKNLEHKQELCVKAEELVQMEDIREAVKQLNTLHEEYKHLGPVPREEQEALWTRFKAASDAVYIRRREWQDTIKDQLDQNLVAKQELVKQAEAFLTFDSDRINDWNEKTNELLALQKVWDGIGGMPRDKAKKTSKTFWAAFKQFFNNKNQFFKKLEETRKANLKLKEELVARAEELKDSEDWVKTANEYKRLQVQWRDIGPVPQKQRESVYKLFKANCDHFFNKRRAHSGDEEKQYVVNLKKKQEICEQIEAMGQSDNDADVEAFENLLEEFAQLGFVPKNKIKQIQDRFIKAGEVFVESIGDLEEDEHERLSYMVKYSLMKSKPNSDKKLSGKENAVRKQISKLEDNITLWRNNLEFFADSKKADKLKEDFQNKIDDAVEKVSHLKNQLRVIREIE